MSTKMVDKNGWVLTDSELLEAVVRGMADMGLFGDGPKMYVDVADLVNAFQAGQRPVDLQFMMNGAVLTLLDPRAVNAEEQARESSTAMVGASGDQRASGAGGEEVSEAGEPEGPTAEVVKTALVEAMERPPGITTIAKWDAKQREAALRWCRKVAKAKKSGLDTPTRPDFIVERAARGSKTVAPATGGTNAPKLDKEGNPPEQKRKGRKPPQQVTVEEVLERKAEAAASNGKTDDEGGFFALGSDDDESPVTEA